MSVKVKQIQEKLATQITADVHNTLMSPSGSSSQPPADKLSLAQLKDAFSVVSVLEDQKVKADLLKWFICEYFISALFRLLNRMNSFFYSIKIFNFIFFNFLNSPSIARIRAIIPRE